MGNKKTNADYLREIIEKNMPESHRDEAIEFLEGIEKECDDLEDERKDAENEASDWENKYDKLKDEYDELEDRRPESLQEEMVIESFNKLVGRVGLLRVERLLDELNAAPYLG